MRVDIELSGGRGPVRLLRSLPDYQVGLLQGYNGIGKSLTVRLLQVLTGTLPYPPGDPAWPSMCRSIGPGTVSISGLQGVGSVQWVFDSTRWETRGTIVTDDWFIAVTADDEPINMSEIRRLLQVRRLAGDESLLDSLALMVDVHRSNVDRLASDLTEGQGRLVAAEELVEEAAALLDRVQPTRLAHDRDVANRGARELEDLAALRDQQAARLAHLEAATDASRALATLRMRAPQLDGQIRHLDGRLQEINSERDELDAQLKVQTQRAAVSETVRRELENARRTRDRNRDKLSSAAVRLSAAASLLAVEPVPQAVQAATTACQAALADLEARKAATDAVPQLRTTLEGMTGPLDRAVQQGLADHELLTLQSRPVTVEDLTTATRRRRKHLEGLPPAPEVAALDRQIAIERRRLAQLAELPELMDEVDRFQRLFAQQEQRLTALLATGALEAADRVQALAHRRGQLDHELVRLATERAAAAQQRAGIGGGATVAQLERDLSEQLAAADVALPDLPQQLATIAAAHAELLQRLARQEAAVMSAATDLARQLEELREVRIVLAKPEWHWVAACGPIPGDDSAAAWIAARQADLTGVRDRLGELRNSLLGVGRALAAIAAELRGGESQATLFEDALRRWLSDEFSRYFNQALLVQHLFPGGSSVRVNLAARHVTWQASGTDYSRPLTAFSSGEQAFAYTQARLADLDLRDAPVLNRLLVLDEFGSFIADDRLHTLYELLLRRRQWHPYDQVLIVLPLREDFEGQAAKAAGDERKRLLAMAESLREHDYVVQDLAR